MIHPLFNQVLAISVGDGLTSNFESFACCVQRRYLGKYLLDSLLIHRVDHVNIIIPQFILFKRNPVESLVDEVVCEFTFKEHF